MLATLQRPINRNLRLLPTLQSPSLPPPFRLIPVLYIPNHRISHERPNTIPAENNPHSDIYNSQDSPEVRNFPVIDNTAENAPGDFFLSFAVAEVLEADPDEEGREDCEYAGAVGLGEGEGE